MHFVQHLFEHCFLMIFLMFFQISKTCRSFKNIVFLQEFNAFHIIYFGLNRCIHHPKNCDFIIRFKLFFAYNLSAFLASILATKIHWFLPWFWAQNGSKKRPESFRKSLKFHCLSPGGHFGTPWLILGLAWAPFLASLWPLGMFFLPTCARSGVFVAFRGHCYCNFRSI